MRANDKPSKKATPAKAARNKRAPLAPVPVAATFKPVVRFCPTVVPLDNGRFEIIPGRPVVTDARGEDEITTAQFAEETGISQDRVQELCEQGNIAHRRKSPVPRSVILITRAEMARYLQATREER